MKGFRCTVSPTAHRHGDRVHLVMTAGDMRVDCFLDPGDAARLGAELRTATAAAITEESRILPSPEDLYGADPNHTGGTESTEYLHQMRARRSGEPSPDA